MVYIMCATVGVFVVSVTILANLETSEIGSITKETLYHGNQTIV